MRHESDIIKYEEIDEMLDELAKVSDKILKDKKSK